MSNQYIDILVVRTAAGQTTLAQAPGFSYLEKDDEVIMEYFKDPGTVKAWVVGSHTIENGGEEYRFFMAINDNKPIPKVLMKVMYKNVEYYEEEEGGEENG